MEMRIDNLQMDMTGVELSVANAHLQVQRIEDDVLKPYIVHMDKAQEDHRILEEDLRCRVEHRGRVDSGRRYGGSSDREVYGPS